MAPQRSCLDESYLLDITSMQLIYGGCFAGSSVYARPSTLLESHLASTNAYPRYVTVRFVVGSSWGETGSAVGPLVSRVGCFPRLLCCSRCNVDGVKCCCCTCRGVDCGGFSVARGRACPHLSFCLSFSFENKNDQIKMLGATVSHEVPTSVHVSYI